MLQIGFVFHGVEPLVQHPEIRSKRCHSDRRDPVFSCVRTLHAGSRSREKSLFDLGHYLALSIAAQLSVLSAPLR